MAEGGVEWERHRYKFEDEKRVVRSVPPCPRVQLYGIIVQKRVGLPRARPGNPKDLSMRVTIITRMQDVFSSSLISGPSTVTLPS